MLDLAKIQLIAQSYSQRKNSLRHWERQRQFNEFDGEEVITDLSLISITFESLDIVVKRLDESTRPESLSQSGLP